MRRPARSAKSLSIAEFIPEEKLRIVLIGLGILSGFLLILGKLYLEQIQSGEEHRERISRQSIRRIRIPARRGKIFTSDLKLLADNSAECNLLFYPEEMRQRRRSDTIQTILKSAETMAEAIGRPNPLNATRVERHLNTRPGLPLTVFKQLTPVEAARALETARTMRGVDIEPDESRSYPAGSFAAHLIGYTGIDSPQEAADREKFSYYIPDRIGRDGIERAFDRLPGTGEDAPLGLRGLPGYSLVQVDHLGFIRQTIIDKIEPLHGNNVILTIDSRAQEIAESLLVGKRAAFVLLDATNGDVLASASSPTFDLSKFAPYIPADYYGKLRNDQNRPLYDRALLGNYTPGSILKPLVALAFLNAGIDPREKIDCTGAVEIGNTSVRCAAWRSGGHGSVDLVTALEHSCNAYMIEHALKVGLAPIAEVLASAGIGRTTGLELAETRGVFPTDAAKRRRTGTRWNRYDTALLSIGQGIVTLSPLQAAVFTAALANGGTIYQPHLVRKVVDSYGNPLYERRPQARGELATKPEYLEIVRQGMFEVVNSPYGSGREAKVSGLTLYGKTGSAEVGPVSDRRLTTWFICFTTFRGRTYAAATMVEEGRSGGKSCAPLAAEFFYRYLLSDGSGTGEETRPEMLP